MTAERTPLAVLMTALGESMSGLPSPGATAVANTPNTLAQAQLSQKKRKRTVACGHCDACGRDDCGRCLNCLDKPKFGGQGIRKQSCLERKCRFPTSATIVTTTTVSAGGPSSAAPKPAPAASATPPPPQTKAREEWDDFWGAVECCMRLQTNPQPSAAIAADERGNKKARTARCGSCTGCVRGDCGECKNCLDKPKFGGRGIKKQACLQRVCCNPQEEDPDESPGPSPKLKPATPKGFCSTDATPKLDAMAEPTVDTSPPPLELPESSAADYERAERPLQSKKVSFADQDPARRPNEPVAYSTDDEEEQAAQKRQIWGAALENRAALASPLTTPPLPPLVVPTLASVPEAALDATPVAATPAPSTGASSKPTPCSRGDAHEYESGGLLLLSTLENQQRQPIVRSEREAGAAEALVMAGCGSTAAQLPLMLLLSASASR